MWVTTQHEFLSLLTAYHPAPHMMPPIVCLIVTLRDHETLVHCV